MSDENSIAIVGMSGRFPGARDLAAFWRNLEQGVESVTHFTREELIAAGVDPAQVDDPDYVRARSLLDDVEMFDAAFFGINPAEASAMDPQQRVFLEGAWQALEDAGYDAQRYPGAIGLYGGQYMNTYLLENLVSGREFVHDLLTMSKPGMFQTFLGNDKDYLATRASYKMNLRGPAMTVQTACSTSLVAVCHACQALQTYQCDMALAGGVCITFPQKKGYQHEEGGMLSPDGHCRAFDAQARGTVFGSGMGIVVLKRLAEARADGDKIWAVIKGSALNNDGDAKVSYTAPSVRGQAEVIALAQALAEVDPATISYVEAHGTGTPLGDPIEVEALTQAFRQHTDEKQFCALGAVKTNIGHLDVASGVAGLIKTVLALHHRQIPPTLHYQNPNPNIPFAESPFYVPTTLQDWPAGPHPRRAGVSSFGVGGTNAHLVLEEAPAAPEPAAARPEQLLLLSAKTPTALEQAARNLADFLENTDAPLADVAYTLQAGRRQFAHRRFFLTDGDAGSLREADPKRTKQQDRSDTPVAFLFPGQGSQYPQMATELYASEPVFRHALDRCLGLLGESVRAALFGDDAAALARTRVAQPAIFAIEYSLAQLWLSWGLKPTAVLGHSVGEFAAACVAGALTLEDAARLLTHRARLADAMPGGSMLAVRLRADELAPYLSGEVSHASHNAEKLQVLSGPTEAIAAVKERLDAAKVATVPLATSHAFHSAMMDPALAELEEFAATLPMRAPEIRWISTCTGEAMGAPDAAYWARQLRQSVRFVEAFALLAEDANLTFLEVGPGNTLSTLVRQQKRVAVASLPSVSEALGQLWLAGVPIDWAAYHGAGRQRVSLPTYPFERKRFWIDAPVAQAASLSSKPMPQAPFILREDDKLAACATAEPRADRIERRVCRILQEFSGLEITGEHLASSFTELGFDSLLLTQARQAFQKEFGVKIAFRQLMEEANSVAELTRLLDREMPADAMPAPVIAPAPSAAPAGTCGTVEEMIRSQLALMQQQLELVRGGGATLTPVRSGPRPPASAKPHDPKKLFGPYRPVNTAADGAPTARQQAQLDDLIERLTRRTAESKRLAAESRAVLADPRSVANFRRLWKELVYQITVDRSAGSRVWDVDGNEYVDITNGFGVTFFGHSPQFITDAISAQLAKGVHIGPQTRLAGEVAARISRCTGMERVTFCNTGSEANIAAMRLARAVTGRKKIVYFSGAYHGTFDEVLQRPTVLDGAFNSAPIAPGIVGSEDIWILDYDEPAALDFLRENAEQVAAVLVEPVQSRRPELQPREFLHALRQLTTEIGAMLIFDEVILGFRLHPGGAQAYFGVKADMATYGKVVGGGLPIGVLAGTPQCMDTLDGGHWKFGDDSVPEADMTFFAGTFTRHPLVLAAAEAVLIHLEKEGPQLQVGLNARTDALVAELNAFFSERAVPIHAVNCGSLFRFHFPGDLQFAPLLSFEMLSRGLYIRDLHQNCFLTTAHSEADVQRIIDVMRESVSALQKADLLPGGAVEDFPLTPGQQEIWMACQHGRDASRAYNESFNLRLGGALDLPALEKAFAAVMGRHEALRATFSADGRTQHIGPRPEITLAVTECAEGEFDQIVAQEIQEPFDLERGPVWRARLVRLAADEHALILTAHHLVCDGWSSNVVLEELAALYTAAVEGRSLQLPPAMPFHEFAEWQAAEENEATWDYWTQLFEPLPPTLELPIDKPRSSTRSFRGSRVSREIAPETCAKIRSAARAEGVTLFAFLLSSYQVLLHRWSGATDLVVGVPAAGQNAMGREDLVGHGANVLPLRSQLDPAEPFSGLLRRVKTGLLDAFEHQNFTFSRLLDRLEVPREPGRVPLVSAFFNLDPELHDLRFGELRTTVQPSLRTHYQFELGFNMVDHDGQLRIECDYNLGFFEASTAERLAANFESLLDTVATAPGTPLGMLPACAPVERRIVLEQFNATASDYPREADLASLFTTQAERTPDARAVRFGSRTLTYSDLEKNANRVARWLERHGAKPGDCIGLCADRSLENVLGTLGIVKAGCAYVPLDPALPGERLQLILDETAAKIVLTLDRHVSRFANSERRVARLDADWESFRRSGSQPLEVTVSGESPAYVMFTSGSTGRPKGVVVPHRAISRLVLRTNYVQLAADDVVGAMANPAFDAATFEIWGALLNGALLHGIDRDTAVDPARFAAEIASSGMTTLFLTTALFNELARQAPRAFAPLRQLLFGGEMADASCVGAVLAGEPPRRLIHVYGPTEATTFATAGDILEVERSTGAVPIGGPISNTQIYLLDTGKRPVGLGATGEIYIGGDGLALEYLGQPEATAERFPTLDPSTGEPVRLYRTGDLARWLPNGMLEFKGRTDAQVKIRGHRIEPGEIEAALASHPGVRESAVLVRATDHGPELRACVSPVEGATLTLGDLRAFLRSTLPDYMIPASFIVVGKFPLTGNGKIDRAALLAGDGEASELVPESAPPITPTETALAAIWSRLLDRPYVGRHDDFFDLGGHSLLAAHLFTELEREKIVTGLPLATLFTAPTVARLAAVIDRERDRTVPVGASLVALQPEGERPPFFCIHGGDGGLIFYRDLAQHLPNDQPFYGIEAPWLHGVSGSYTSLEEIASLYIQEIQTRQPQGPYLLGGFSFGGVVAFEMARQLERQGHEVKFLALFDTSNPAQPARRLSFGERMGRIGDESQKMSLTDRLGYVGKRAWGKVMANAYKEEERLRKISGRLLNRGPLQADLRFLEARDAHVDLMERYLPRPFAGKLTLFRATAEEEGYESQALLGWDGLAAQIEVIHTRGSHSTMLREPNVSYLAAELRARLLGSAASAAEDAKSVGR